MILWLKGLHKGEALPLIHLVQGARRSDCSCERLSGCKQVQHVTSTKEEAVLIPQPDPSPNYLTCPWMESWVCGTFSCSKPVSHGMQGGRKSAHPQCLAERSWASGSGWGKRRTLKDWFLLHPVHQFQQKQKKSLIRKIPEADKPHRSHRHNTPAHTMLYLPLDLGECDPGSSWQTLSSISRSLGQE